MNARRIHEGGRQAKIEHFWSSRLQSLKDGHSTENAREKLIHDIFQILQGIVDSDGLSARAITQRLCPNLTVKEINGLQMWVQAALSAMDARGFAYHTYDETHFLATNTNINLSPEDVSWLKQNAFSDAFLETLVAAVPLDAPNDGNESQTRIRCVRGQKPGLWKVDLECRGRLSRQMIDVVWNKCLNASRKACVMHRGQIFGNSCRGSQIQSAEFNSTSEYLLYGCANGIVSVSKISALDTKMFDSWETAVRAGPVRPIRQLRCGKSIETVHWSLGNRNEIAVATRSSGDVLIYDLKCCGMLSANHNVPGAILSHRQGHGVGGIIDFVALEGGRILIAGSQSGALVLWDRRDPKQPKHTLKQSSEGICYVQVLKDEYSILGGTCGGCVHLWDLRRAMKSMSSMSLGGADDARLENVRLLGQIPVRDAEGRIEQGSWLPPPHDAASFAYALEPLRQSQLGFTVGSSGVVGVVDLISCRVSHVFHPPPSPPLDPVRLPDGLRRRPVWLLTGSGDAALACPWSGAEGDVALLRVRGGGCCGLDGRWTPCGLTADYLRVPGEVTCIAASFVEPYLGVGLKEGSLWSLRLGEGV